MRLRPLFNALATIPWSMYFSAQANAELPAAGMEAQAQAQAEAEAEAEAGAEAEARAERDAHERLAWEAVRPQPIYM